MSVQRLNRQLWTMTSNDKEPCLSDIELTGEGIRIDTTHAKDELVIRWLDQADDRAE